MWQAVGGGMDYDVRSFYNDTIANKLYVVGTFEYAGVGDSIVSQIATWDGTIWNSVGHGTGDTLCLNQGGCNPLLSVSRYENEIFVGGYMNTMGGNYSIKNLSKWDGISWSAIGNPNIEAYLFQANDSLFAVGQYDTMNNQHIEDIAKWNGTAFVPFGTPLPFHSQNGIVHSCTYYQNQYYFSGNFTFSGGLKEIIRWDGNQWQPLGNGILGNNAWAGLSVVFNNLLYVGGFFSQADGNAGNNIMTWDGTTWRDAFPGVNFSNGIRDLIVYNNKLYISAQFTMAGNSGYYYLAHYDGTNFCAFGGRDNIPGLETTPIAIAGFRDTIYMAGNRTFFGDTINYIGKWMGGDSVEACLTIVQTDVNEILTKEEINIYPNPCATQLEIDNGKLPIKEIKIFNVLGEAVLYQQPTTNNKQLTIEVSALSTGIYFIQVKTEQGIIRKKFVKE